MQFSSYHYKSLGISPYKIDRCIVKIVCLHKIQIRFNFIVRNLLEKSLGVILSVCKNSHAKLSAFIVVKILHLRQIMFLGSVPFAATPGINGPVGWFGGEGSHDAPLGVAHFLKLLNQLLCQSRRPIHISHQLSTTLKNARAFTGLFVV